ncbi:MAG: hypothetical protein KGZ52_02690 [Xanthomonadaceae bacterium]|nr:hypothetical protein [Xanthomonadaceae bacterium]
MLRVLALMIGTRVDNVVIGEPANYPGALDVTDANPRPSPGWIRQGQTFVAPPPPAPQSLGTRITKLAFRQRVGPQALAAIELASVHDAAAPVQAQQLAATLRVMLADVQAATFIDLARPDTRAGVQSLEAAGLLPAGKAAEILDTPVQAHEVPVGV